MSTQKIITLSLDGMPDEQEYASFKEVLSDAGIRMQIKEHTASDGKKMPSLSAHGMKRKYRQSGHGTPAAPGNLMSIPGQSMTH